MQKIKENGMFVLVVAMALFIGYKEIAPTQTTDSHDAAVVKLGKEYRAEFIKINMFADVANGSYKDLNELGQAQHDALAKGLSDAYLPISKELEDRFGKLEDDKASVSKVKSFFADLSYGFRGGK